METAPSSVSLFHLSFYWWHWRGLSSSVAPVGHRVMSFFCGKARHIDHSVLEKKTFAAAQYQIVWGRIHVYSPAVRDPRYRKVFLQ